MGSLKLTTASSGSVILSPANTASDVTITVPAVTATMATLTTPSFASTIGVGGATAASSGAGITFPATQSASTDANTLDDYEEGTWTPTVSSGVTSVTYSIQRGTYTKIGNKVFIECVLQLNSGTASGGFVIAGLPFASQSGTTTAGGGAMAYTDNGNTTAATLYNAQGNTTVEFYTAAGAVYTLSSVNAKFIIFTFNYHTA